mmetsp:Transcript_35187/g.43074  ORF Transcript_35187/g.43074 Transcript_35187/m.43074 type:complete len:82 (-) Transcript_35187:104-349(-)
MMMDGWRTIGEFVVLFRWEGRSLLSCDTVLRDKAVDAIVSKKTFMNGHRKNKIYKCHLDTIGITPSTAVPSSLQCSEINII